MWPWCPLLSKMRSVRRRSSELLPQRKKTFRKWGCFPQAPLGSTSGQSTAGREDAGVPSGVGRAGRAGPHWLHRACLESQCRACPAPPAGRSGLPGCPLAAQRSDSEELRATAESLPRAGAVAARTLQFDSRVLKSRHSRRFSTCSPGACGAGFRPPDSLSARLQWPLHSDQRPGSPQRGGGALP